MIEKIAKILAKAERASTEEEAEAYFAAAQRIASAHSIDLAKARAHTIQSQRREQPIRKTIVMDDFGRNTKKHLVRLYHVIAHCNDILIDISRDSMTVYPYGFPSDLEVADAMFAVLAPQMVREANEYLAKGEYKKERVGTKAVQITRPDGTVEIEYRAWMQDGRVARSEFYTAFSERIRLRLAEARQEVIEEYESSGAELVLADKGEEVRDFKSKNSNAKGKWAGPSSSGYSLHARGAGHEAGSRARMSDDKAVARAKEIES